jgi:hypothetical protein
MVAEDGSRASDRTMCRRRPLDDHVAPPSVDLKTTAFDVAT